MEATTEQSTDLTELAKAMAAAQAKIRNASKDSVNPHFGRSYADLASVWEACRGPLTDNGLSVVQQPVCDGPRVGVTTTLLHISGQWMRSTLWVTPERPGAQALGSALTYGRRYSLSAFVGVAPDDDDDDGNAAVNGHARDKSTPAGGAARANTVKATETALMANASQIQQIHIMKEKIGGWTGKAEHPGHPYKLGLAAYKDSQGRPCTTSTMLTYEQAQNFIKRMQGMIDRQAETLKNNEAQAPIAGAMNDNDREPGSDDDDTGEVADPGTLQNVREAAVSVWGKKVKDLAPQWLLKNFNVATSESLSQVQAERALQMLLKGETL